MRVVLDVNVLVSAAITPTPGHVGRDIFDQAGVSYTLLLSEFMVWKLASVLHYARIRTKYPRKRSRPCVTRRIERRFGTTTPVRGSSMEAVKEAVGCGGRLDRLG